MELVKNKIYRCQITDYTSDGMGFAKIEGRAVFVPRTAVGDQCDVRIVKVTKKCGVRPGGKAGRAVRGAHYACLPSSGQVRRLLLPAHYL